VEAVREDLHVRCTASKDAECFNKRMINAAECRYK